MPRKVIASQPAASRLGPKGNGRRGVAPGRGARARGRRRGEGVRRKTKGARTDPVDMNGSCGRGRPTRRLRRFAPATLMTSSSRRRESRAVSAVGAATVPRSRRARAPSCASTASPAPRPRSRARPAAWTRRCEAAGRRRSRPGRWRRRSPGAEPDAVDADLGDQVVDVVDQHRPSGVAGSRRAVGADESSSAKLTPTMPRPLGRWRRAARR